MLKGISDERKRCIYVTLVFLYFINRRRRRRSNESSFHYSIQRFHGGEMYAGDGGGGYCRP